MDWWKKKRLRSVARKQRLVRVHERGEILLEELIECCNGKSNPIKFFSAEQIRKATDNICKCNIPTQGRTNICQCTRVSQLSEIWCWYSGMLNNHRMILINILIYGPPDYPRNFCRDIAISSMVSGHKNFMKLVGCCLEWPYPIMVYYGEKKQYSRIDLEMVLSWKRRIKIAEGIATALAYLHTAFSKPFVYVNMNFRNILLDDDDVVKLSNFSSCVSIPQGETFVKLGYGWGDLDYMDDNYLNNGVVSEKTDVYGFGIVMQKLLTGEERFSELYGRNAREGLKRNFTKWLSESRGERRMDEIVDPKMLEKMGEIPQEECCGVEAFLFLSERCIGLRGEVPKMVEVAKELKRFLKDDSSSGETQNISPSALLPNQDET